MTIQSKLTLLLVLLTLAVVAITSIFSVVTLEAYFQSRIVSELRAQADQAEYLIRSTSYSDTGGYEHLQKYIHYANLRLTLIDEQGVVLFESDLPHSRLSQVENHLLRPEVQRALQDSSGFGTSTRHSTTLQSEMLYLAKRISAPFPPESRFGTTKILRCGIQLTHVNQVMTEIRSQILIIGAIVLILVGGISFLLPRRIARPATEMMKIAEEIRAGHLDRRVVVRSHDELGMLGETLNSMVDKLNDDIKRLQRLERVRSEFLGNVSHELRTPIFAIQGMLETLLNGALEDRDVNRDFVQRALHNIQNLNALLADLIEISRIESGEMKMSFRYFDLRAFLEPLVSDLQPLAKQHHVSLILDPWKEPFRVYGDKERLKQVLTNLISNAVKYNTTGGRVAISVDRVDEKARISVRDTGIGIPDEHLQRIFERFYRVEKERSRETGGTGLGLAIAKHIVEAHDSRLEVESEVGKGSSFYFTLKL